MVQFSNFPPDPRYVDIIAMDRIDRGVAASDLSLERRGQWITRDSGDRQLPSRSQKTLQTSAQKSLKMAGPYVDLRASESAKRRSSKARPVSAKSTDRDVAELGRRLGDIDIELCEPTDPADRKAPKSGGRPFCDARLTRRLSVPTSRRMAAPEMVARSHSAPVGDYVHASSQSRAPVVGPSSCAPSRRNSIACPAVAPLVPAHPHPPYDGHPGLWPLSPVIIGQPCFVEVTAVYPVSPLIAPMSQPMQCGYFPSIPSGPMSPTPMAHSSQQLYPGLAQVMYPSTLPTSTHGRVRRWRACMELEEELEDVPEEGTICDARAPSNYVDDIGSSVSQRAHHRAMRDPAPHPAYPPAQAGPTKTRHQTMSNVFADPAFQHALVGAYPSRGQTGQIPQSRSTSIRLSARLAQAEWDRHEHARLSR